MSDDLISRRAAIELLQEKIKKIYFLKTVSTNLGEWLNELPSIPEPIINLEKSRKESQEYCAECEHAEMCSWYPTEGCEFRQIKPEQKTGYWFDVGSLSCRCSECGCKNSKESNYCPECGAYMKG